MCVGGLLHGRCIGCPPGPNVLIPNLPAPAPSPSPKVPPPALPVNKQVGEKVTVPLTGVITSVLIKDFTAEVNIKQRFENTESLPIEAVYEFPVDPKFAVCAFRAEVDGKVIEGKIKEKQKARETYDDAIAQGHGAYLLEEKDNQPSVFSASVGNLPAGKAVLLTITYVTELDFEDGKLKYVLPTQPYAPNGRDPTPKFTNPKSQEYVKDVPYGLKVEVKFDMTSNIKSISSPTHPINFEFGDSPKNATVTLIIPESGSPLLKDFVISTTLFDPHQPCVRIEDIGGGKKAALVALYPKMDEEGDVFTEMIFVVDQSGSMAGSRMNSVKETLQIFLRSIPEGTLFNIVGFGTNTKSLFPQSKEYNDSSLATAVKFVEQMFANLGGTNIIKPLMEIFNTPAKPGIPRQLFLLTDGEVNNTQECIDTVRKHAVSTRVFTFGIGNDASKTLVTGMAEAGEGKAEFVRPGDNMEEKVLRQLQRALKPAFTDFSVDWGDQKCIVQQGPYRLPPVFSGQRVIVYGLFGGNITDGNVTLKAATPKGPWTASVPLVSANVKPGKLIHRLAARALIRDLTEKRSYMHDNAMKLSGKYKEDDVKKEVISLSTASGVASSFTSFVAVEERSEATIGEMQLRKIAVADAPAQAPLAIPQYQAQQPQQSQQKQQMGIGGFGWGGPMGAAAPPPPGAMPNSSMAYRLGSSAAGPPPPPASHSAPAPYGGPPPSYGYAAPAFAPPAGSPPPAKGGTAPPRPGAAASSSVMLEGSFGRSSNGSSADMASLSAPMAPQRRLSSDRKKKESEKSSSPRSSASHSLDLLSFAEAEQASPMNDLLGSISSPSNKMLAQPPAQAALASSSWSAPPLQPQVDYAFTYAPTSVSASAPMSPPKPTPAAKAGPSSSFGPDVSIIIKQASASGSFPLAALTAIIPSASLQNVRAALPAGISGAQAEAIFITAIVVALFAARYPDKKINWDLVAQKARKWIKKEAAAINADSADWDGAAQKFLAAYP